MSLHDIQKRVDDWYRLSRAFRFDAPQQRCDCGRIGVKQSECVLCAVDRSIRQRQYIRSDHKRTYARAK